MTTTEEIRQLVLARLKTLPGGLKIAIGGEGPITKEEMIRRVTLGDEVGQKIMAVQMEYLRGLKNTKNPNAR